MNDSWQNNPDDQQPHTSPTYEAPPTHQGEISTQAGGTKWPKVFGIISIVLGSLGIAGGGCGLISIPMNAVAATAAQQQGGVNAATFGGPIAWQVFSQILAIAMAGLLLAAGIALLKRRPQGIKLHKLWAYIAIPVWLISTIIGTIFAMQASSAATTAGGNQISPGMIAAFMIPGLLIGLVFALAYPIIVIVWLNRPQIKAEYERWN